jgi:FG-GAP-like repeat/FG-GAP repeat
MGWAWLFGGVLSWGCIESKTYTPLPPSVPLLRGPQNDAYEGSVISGSLQPRFVWEPSIASDGGGGGGLITYELQYTADASFVAAVTTVRTTEASYQPEAALPVSMAPPVGRRYYWRVRACVESNCSEYSRPWWVNVGRSYRDLNGDGYADVAIGAGLKKMYVYYGGPSSSIEPTPDGVLTSSDVLDSFAGSVSFVGDLNADGFGELAIGSPGDDAVDDAVDSRAGSVFVYYGRAGTTFKTTPDVILSGAFLNDLFGYSIDQVGDLNGDGYPDLVVGARFADGQAMDSGRVYIYLGRPELLLTRADKVLDGERVSGWFGEEVAGVGDLNGDGLADLVVNERPLGIDAPKVCQSHVFFGSSSSFGSANGARLFFDYAGDCALAANRAGDIDHDGFSDVAFLRTKTYPDLYTPHLFRGGPSVLGDYDVAFTVPAVTTGTAYGIRSASDVNHDGYDDVVISTLNGLGLHLGRRDGTVEKVPVALPVRGGFDVVGDINGDGFDDVISGAPGDGVGGRAYIYLGRAAETFDFTVDGTLEPGVAGDSFGVVW